jgi:alpha-L-fucosidase
MNRYRSTMPSADSPQSPEDRAAHVARLATRPLPEWFSDAKLGIFVHWTAATVPAFAPIGPDPFELAAEHGWEKALSHTPYVEWYENSVAIEGSPAHQHHLQTYGSDYPYARFVETFRQTANGADINAWADLFATSGAGYAVLVTKHHDGVTLWPSATPNPHQPNWTLTRDIVGDFASAVRAKGLHFGAYYSGGLDWTFIGPTTGHPVDSMEAMMSAIPQSDEYAAYANAHWRELVERYEPEVLWNDIGYPKAGNMHDLFDWYYARIPTGIVNDRFDFIGTMKGRAHADFRTPEYSGRDAIDPTPWETTRGLGTSFGYNAWATDDDLIEPFALVRFFIDTVSKGGNLLLNVGPNADGEIPWNQASRLHALGHWMTENRAAIVASRPWTRFGGTASHGGEADLDVRFTRNGDDLFALVLGRPDANVITLLGMADAATPERVEWLGRSGSVECSRTGDDLTISLPVRPADTAAVGLRLVGAAK